jgi:hypothetical protein
MDYCFNSKMRETVTFKKAPVETGAAFHAHEKSSFMMKTIQHYGIVIQSFGLFSLLNLQVTGSFKSQLFVWICSIQQSVL